MEGGREGRWKEEEEEEEEEEEAVQKGVSHDKDNLTWSHQAELSPHT